MSSDKSESDVSIETTESDDSTETTESETEVSTEFDNETNLVTQSQSLPSLSPIL